MSRKPDTVVSLNSLKTCEDSKHFQVKAVPVWHHNAETPLRLVSLVASPVCVRCHAPERIVWQTMDMDMALLRYRASCGPALMILFLNSRFFICHGTLSL